MTALPPALAQAVERRLAGIGRAGLAEAADRLSRRYRAGPGHAEAPDEILAYLATRLPATYAASHAALASLAARCPDLAPGSLLDLGAGPGTAAWAALAVFPSIETVTLIEREPAFRACGAALAAEGPLARARWLAADLERSWPAIERHDLVVASFVLAEIAPERQPALLAQGWAAATTLLLVEPGTPAGFRRIAAARARLLAEGAAVASPCPHALPCPLLGTEGWCHAAVRLPRSRTHRQVKGAALGFEDEKYSHVALTRGPVAPIGGLVLYPPRVSKPEVAAFVCEPDGTARWRHVPVRDRAGYRAAARWRWGEALE